MCNKLKQGVTSLDTNNRVSAMQTKEYRNFDKSEWGPGPWQDEPDKLQWQDEATGLPCLIVRNSNVTGSLCGYVGVAEGHPDFGKGYGELEVDAHGGLRFADFCTEGAEEASHICHVPDPGEPTHVWWFGFDCSHAGDRSPAMDALRRNSQFAVGRQLYHERGETYRDIAYVKAEVERLAAQLHARAVR